MIGLAGLFVFLALAAAHGQAQNPHNVYSDEYIQEVRTNLRTDTVGPTRAYYEWKATEFQARKVLRKATVKGNNDSDSLICWAGPKSPPLKDGYGVPYYQGIAIQACALYGRVLQKPAYINATITALMYQFSIRAADISTWRTTYGLSGYTDYCGPREGAWIARLTISLDLIDSCMTTAQVDTGKAFLTRGAHMIVHLNNENLKVLWPWWTQNNITAGTPGMLSYGWADSNQVVKYDPPNAYQLTVNAQNRVLTHVGGYEYAVVHGYISNRRSEGMLGVAAVGYYTGDPILLGASYGYKRLFHKYGQGPKGIIMEYGNRNGGWRNPQQGVYYGELSTEFLILQAVWDLMNGSRWAFDYTTTAGYAGSASPGEGKGVRALVYRQVWQATDQNPIYWKRSGVSKYRLDFTSDSSYVENGNVKGLQYFPYAIQMFAGANIGYNSDSLKQLYEGTLPSLEKPPAGYATGGAGGTSWHHGGGTAVLASTYIMLGHRETAIVTAPCTPSNGILTLTLVDATRDVPVREIRLKGDIINLADLKLAGGINFSVLTCPASVGSVECRITRLLPTSRETVVTNVAPYCLKGCSSGNYYPWVPKPGSYILELRVWTGAGRTGTSGPWSNYYFTITNGVKF